MDPLDPKSRLKLNFQGYNTDRNFQPSNERVFPTTPSTFPQPVFGTTNTAAATADHGGFAAGAAGNGQNAYAAPQVGGYFPPYGSQQQTAPSPMTQNTASFPSNPAFPAQRGTYPQTYDPTSPLTHQFANQNLGGPQRQGSPFARQASPVPRAYNASPAANGQPPRSPHGLPSPALDGPGRSPSLVAEIEPPNKMPGKYPPGITKRGQNLHAFVETFFKENISRARERNKR